METKSLLSNFDRDEFSVTPEIAITIKFDVTEKLSRNRDLIADLILSKQKQLFVLRKSNLAAAVKVYGEIS